MGNGIKKLLVGVAVLGATVLASGAIMATAKKPDESKEVDVRPIVEVSSLSPINHQVTLSSFGEVRPFESTRLAAQVSGEVVSWNKNFLAGGIVKRGDVLFTIEKDNYQAAVLQAEAELARAQAALIEEKALQQVAKDEAARDPKQKRSALFLREPQVISAQAAVKSAEAALRRAQRDLANCEVSAPFDALIVSRDIGLGQFVSMGNQVATLHNVEAAEVIAPIAGFDSAFLPTNLEGTSAQVMQQGVNSFSLDAVVDRDLGLVDSATRMSNVVVKIDDPYAMRTDKPKLKFGSYVEVRFEGQMLKQVYRLKQNLVNNSVVWVVDENNHLQPRKVNVLRKEDLYFYIDQGLTTRDRVVQTLPEYPQEDMEVRIAGAQPSENMPTQDVAAIEQGKE